MDLGWRQRDHKKIGVGVATAYGLLCGVDSYEENGIFRLVSIIFLARLLGS